MKISFKLEIIIRDHFALRYSQTDEIDLWKMIAEPKPMYDPEHPN